MATTEVQAREQGPGPTARPWRRRLAVAGVATAVLVVTSGAVVLSQDEVTATDGMSMVVVRDAPPADLGGFSDTDLDDGAVTEVTTTSGTEYRVAAEDGRYLDLVVSVRNEGLVPVRLTDVVPTLASEESVHVLDDVQVSVPVDATQTAWRSVDDGVVLDPGRSMPIRMTGRLATACRSAAPPVEAGGSIGTDRLLELSYEVLGLPREASPAASWTVLLDGPLGCPAPTS